MRHAAILSVLDGVANWQALIADLMIRETRTRFASGKLGYLWAFLMPALWIAGLVAFFGYLGHQPAIIAPVPYFVATGMLPYITFRQTITALTRALAANKHLIGFGGIRAADILFAVMLLELVSAMILAALVLIFLNLVFGPADIIDPFRFLTGLVAAWMIGASFGRLAAIAGHGSDFVTRILPIALRPMFWISGIFFAAVEVPPPVLAILWFNPLLHAVELSRGGFFGLADSGFATLAVPLAAAAMFYLLSRALPQIWPGDRPRQGVWQ